MSLKLRKPDFLKSDEEKENEAQTRSSVLLEKSINAFTGDFTIRVREDGVIVLKEDSTLLKLTPDKAGDIVFEFKAGITKITVESNK